ncbi:MAG: hypothetical protein ABSC48_10215, partial [Terracidiphilus sp.]
PSTGSTTGPENAWAIKHHTKSSGNSYTRTNPLRFVVESAVKGKEIRPDVFAVMPSGPPLVIEIEASIGQKLQMDGPRHRESRLRDKTKFIFILSPEARCCKKKASRIFR